MAIRQKKAATGAPDTALESLLDGVNPNRAMPEKKFQEILDHYNARNPDKEQGLSGVKLYFFRTFPQTNNVLSGRPHSNIEVFECVRTAGEVPELSELPADLRDYVTKRHGGGRYRVSLNDKARASTQVAQTALKIDEIEYPPILDPKELVTKDPETAGWITRQVSLGLLSRLPDGSLTMSNGMPARPAAAATDENPGLAAVAMEALRQNQRGAGVEEHGYKTVIDMIKDNAPKPTDPLATIAAMATLMKPAGDGGGVTAMCSLLSTMMVENNKMMMFMMAQKNPAPRDRGEGGDGVDQVERIMEMVGKYGGPKPSGGGIMDMLKEWMPMLLPLLMMGKMPPQQAAAAAAALAAGRPGADTAAPVDTGTPGGGPLTQAQAEEFAGRATVAMQRGVSGDDFALAVEVIFGPETYDKIRQLGRDNIIGFLLQSRAAQFFGANGQATTQFITEFLSYGDETPAAPGTPATPPPAAQPATTPATA